MPYANFWLAFFVCVITVPTIYYFPPIQLNWKFHLLALAIVVVLRAASLIGTLTFLIMAAYVIIRFFKFNPPPTKWLDTIFAVTTAISWAFSLLF